MTDSHLLRVGTVALSGIVAGGTAQYTFAVIPVILKSPNDKVMVHLWREQYRLGSYTVPPISLLTSALWGTLAYGVGKSSPYFKHYTSAAVAMSLIIPFTRVILSGVNGALCLRAEKLVGPGEGSLAETYALNDVKAKRLEETKRTDELVQSWAWYNVARVLMQVGGTLVGTWATLQAR